MSRAKEFKLFDVNLSGFNCLFFSVLTLVFSACGGGEDVSFSPEKIKEFESQLKQRPIVIERNGTKLTEVTDIPKFENASLKLLSNNIKFQPGSNLIEFDIEGYNLGDPTMESKKYFTGNGSNEQSIVIISQNDKANQFNEAKADLNLKLGSNKMVAFLTRSYNVCLKQSKAACFFEINIDSKGSTLQTNLTDSLLYVNSPRGNYNGNDVNNVIFDFYLSNIVISSEGNYISLFVDEVEFKIYKYAAYRIEGLAYGKHLISAKIKNKEGDVIKNVISTENTYNIELKEVSIFE